MPSAISPHIARLFLLCNAPLTYDSVRERCLDFGWVFDEDSPEGSILRVRVDDRVSVFAASLEAGQPYGRTVYLPLFCTEDPYDCISETASDNKPDFVEAYRQSQSLFEDELGPASSVGSYDFGGSSYQFAIWRGKHAVLALLQDDFDVQFGSEISAWIIECPENSPLPQLPPHT